MIENLHVVGLITARGGSKGLPRKNILPLLGKPLIGWTVEAAKRSAYIDRVVVSSDDLEIISIAEQFGCEAPFRRPTELSTDTATSMDVIRHALSQLPRCDLLVLLQPTSPLRAPEDIDRAIEDCINNKRPSTVTVTAVGKPLGWMFLLKDDGTLRSVEPADPTARRQDLPELYAINGAVYVARPEWLLRNGSFMSSETGAVVMPRERSVDIDDRIDLDYAEFLAKRTK